MSVLPKELNSDYFDILLMHCVDAVTIGFKAPSEIDEAITRINNHLNA